MLLQTLSKEAKRALNGFALNLSNIEKLSSQLPEQDKHLLTPPVELPASDLYDIMHLIQLGRTPGQAQELFSRLILKYYDMDRNLRVSSSNFFYCKRLLMISIVYSVSTEQKSGTKHQFSWLRNSKRVYYC